MIVYMAVVVGIGFWTMKQANNSSAEYFLGNRRLGPWVAALSAEASDMSGWLLMGLPGVAYWFGLSDAFWTAVGLAVGTYLNWRLVSHRLRAYSIVADDAITLPDYFSRRFKEKRPVLLLIASLIILVFFSVYVGSCFVAGGKLFSTLFDANYQLVMIIGAVIVVLYTLMGGFMAESISDLVQAIIMILALAAVLIAGLASAGGIGAVISNVKNIPGFLDFFGIASPTIENGVQAISEEGAPVFGAAGAYGFLTVISTMAWGLGYFGMPQVLLRFFAIRKASELKRSRRIATIWCVLSLAFAVFIGIIGRALYPVQLHTTSEAENVFILASQTLFHPLFAGLVMAGILAASMSSSDSYLLIASSAVSVNFYKNVLHKEASDKQVLRISRIVLGVIALFGIIIALDQNSIIFNVVSFAWAGFGAAFGPLVLFSLFWKRANRAGAVAGMLGGAVMVFFWKFALKPMGGVLGVYELLPAFIFSSLLIVVVSLATAKPSKEIEAEFDTARLQSKAALQ
ncbi:MAG: sodium/proline symporter PutP [Oscillospiraceae bacterium]|jgi:sodium/proline symporter|nr:sodium/proline symporter PutP [Oscillospiraceae bacterium]